MVGRKRYWHLLPIKRSHTYRRLALEHSGAEGKVSECVIVRAHDRSLPLKIKMFFSSNRVQKTLGASETKDAAQDWDSPQVIFYDTCLFYYARLPEVGADTKSGKLHNLSGFKGAE